MHCDQCGKENREGSKFCRYCGTRIDVSADSNFKGRRASFKSPLTLRRSTAAALVVILVVGAALMYGGSKAYGYFRTEAKIAAVAEAQRSGEYDKSLELIAGLEGRNLSESQKQEVGRLKSDSEKFLGFKASVNAAARVVDKGDTADAKDIQEALHQLHSVDESYPGFAEVKGAIDKLEASLLVALQGDVERSKKAAAEAKAQAAREKQSAAAAQAARERAEEETQQVADDAARAAANAQAEASASKAAEVKISFRNQLVIAYNSYIQATGYYSSAINYSNQGDSLLALAQANSAQAVLNSAYESVYDLNSRFSGMPTTYVAAANSLVNAINNLKEATRLLSISEGTTLDYSSSINSYKSAAANYAANVKMFLNGND